MHKSLCFSVLWSVLSASLLTAGLTLLFLQPSQWSAVLSLHEQHFLLHVTDLHAPPNWIYSVAPMRVKKISAEDFRSWSWSPEELEGRADFLKLPGVLRREDLYFPFQWYSITKNMLILPIFCPRKFEMWFPNL